jgi:hypothetical protein
MEGMGHNSTRAALIYLHASRAGDRRIADGIGRQLAGDDGEDQSDRTAATGRPGGQLGRDLMDLARGPIWRSVRRPR